MDMLNYMWNIKKGPVTTAHLVIKLFKHSDILSMSKHWALAPKLGHQVGISNFIMATSAENISNSSQEL